MEGRADADVPVEWASLIRTVFAGRERLVLVSPHVQTVLIERVADPFGNTIDLTELREHADRLRAEGWELVEEAEDTVVLRRSGGP